MFNKKLKFKFSALLLAIVISSAGFFGCGDTVAPGPGENLSFSSLSSNDSAGDNQNYFVLDTVKILIKDIKLNVSGGNEKNFKVGPFVLFLNFSSGVNHIGTSIIPPGVYDKVKFEIHKLQDNEAIPDPEFADANGRYSVIVKGWYYGKYFVYKSTKSAHQILHFPADLPITEQVMQNITLVVSPYIWFIRDFVYMDPSDAANTNDIDNNIKDNIKNNFKSFKDNDKNGLPD